MRHSGLMNEPRFAGWRTLLRRRLVGGTLALALVTLPEMRHLHHEYFDDDSPTDVITFPANEPWVAGAGQHLGDIVICRDVAEEQAREASHTYWTEVAFLMLHGMLHIAGYDDADETSRREMIETQSELLVAFEEHKRGT